MDLTAGGSLHVAPPPQPVSATRRTGPPYPHARRGALAVLDHVARVHMEEPTP